MTPERDRKLRVLMEESPIGELAPGFDKESEWEQLSDRLRGGEKKRTAFTWAYAAAILVLLVCAGFVARYMNSAPQPDLVKNDIVVLPPVTDNALVDTSADNERIAGATMTNDSVTDKKRTIPVTEVKKPTTPQRVYASVKYYKTKDIICNGTPCPIQICISQTMKCPNTKPKPISTCATLEAEQSVKLEYTEHHEVAKNCSVTVDEIEIKSVATGETILLNATSAPYTAQDVFSYIQGEKKGDIMAGVFRHDCDEQKLTKGLRLDNSYGDMIIRQ